MPQQKQPISIVDSATKVLTLLSLGIAVFAAWKALPADSQIKRLQAQAQELDIAVKKNDSELKGIESSRKVTLELYQEVKKVIEKKDKDPREEDAVRVLVESLADDPFRWKLLKVLAVGAKSPEVKQAAAATSMFYEEESSVQRNLAAQTPAAVTNASTNFASFNIDFFYCEKKRATSEPLARSALGLKGSGENGRWRIRALPESVNQQPGYSVTSSEIRFTPPQERSVAEALSKALATKNIRATLHETSYPTPGYVSVFICQ